MEDIIVRRVREDEMCSRAASAASPSFVDAALEYSKVMFHAIGCFVTIGGQEGNFLDGVVKK
jgi:hypothetical protein